VNAFALKRRAKKAALPMKKNSNLSRIFLAAALFLAALRCPAEDAAGIPAQQENRFLFVVDTSYAMRGYSNAVVQSVAELLASDMRGEFRQGDTIGLWLYNDRLDTQYPMQVWSKADKVTIAEDMAAFLRGRRYEKLAYLERVMPTLNQVIKTSERITVVLIFDGTGSIQGTPFDKEIHALQRKYARELRSARVPFVIVLAARDGVVFDYTINYPGLVAIPHTANPEKPVETNAPVATIAIPVTNTPARPRPSGSIILSRPAPVVHATAPPPVVVASPVIPPPAKPAPPVVVASVPAPPPASQPAIVVSAPPSATVMTNDQQSSPTPAVVQNAPVASISPTGGPGFVLFAVAFALLTVAVVLVVFLVHRYRNPPQSSLITQSIDHHPR
jgi:hypothetical protein